ncbi:MAG: two-component regulator propeller domain-containing protein [Bacteroidales bacterium]
MTVRLFSVLWLFIIINHDSKAQYHFTQNITINDGLPSNSIQCIFKDSRGYYWFGTEAGLCRFDGINYKVYTQQDGLAGNRIWSITEDTQGNLWIACYGKGISKFDGETFYNYSSKDGLVNDNVRKVRYSARNNGLLIGTEFGFSFYKDSVFTSFQDKSITKRDLMQVTDFLDCDTLIYIFTYYDSNQFLEFNPKTKVFRYLPKAHRYHYKSNKTTCSYITLKNDTIIGDLNWGLKIYTKDSIIVNDNVGQIFDIAEDKKGSLWLASWNDGTIAEMKTRGGIYRMNNYKADYYSDSLGVKSQECFCLYFDKNENILWMGTLDKGIYKFPVSGIDYTTASNLNHNKPFIHDLLKDSKGNIWISVGDKIIKRGREPASYSVSQLQTEYNNIVNQKYSFLIDPSGSFPKYQNLIEKDLYKFKNPYIQNNKILSAGSMYKPQEFKKLINMRITDLYRFFEDKSGNMWIQTNAGFFIIKNDSIFFMVDDPNVNNSYFVEQGNVISMLSQYNMTRYTIPDFEFINDIQLRRTATYSSFCNFIKDQDVFWIYNNTDGVFKYKSGKFTQFNNLRYKIDLSFTSLCKDKQNNLIAGTNSGTVYIMNFPDDSLNVLFSITEQNGIIGTDIRWILSDNNNRLWFATNKGLNMIDLNRLYNEGKKEISFFNEENGFFDKQSTKAILDSSGNILVMSEINLFRLNPDELIKNTDKINKLKIDNIEVNFHKYDWPEKTGINNWTGIPGTNLILPFNENTLTFYFHLLQFSGPSKAQYSYKLDGFQDNWTPFTPEMKAVFNNLRNGRFLLRIRGRLISSPARITEIEYPIRILPPWYRTWWFYCFTFLIVSILIFLFLRNRFRAIKRKSEIDRKISELKMEALKSQMNPHFIFNAFNSIQKYILQQDSRAALDYMSEFALLIRQTLDNSTKNQISLSDEIKYLTSYIDLEKRRVLNLGYVIEVASDIDPEDVFLPPMLIQPFVENAIIHGIRHLESKGNIFIKFKMNNGDSILICTVEDNGIGRAKANEINEVLNKTHKSQGTRNTFQRMELFGISSEIIDLFNEKEIPSGTKVELRIRL